VLINAQNQLGLGSSTSTALVHTAATNGAEAASALVATTSTPVLPPQPLYRAPAIDRGPAAPRFFEKSSRSQPLDWPTPALGWDFVSRAAPVEALDLIAIAAHAAALDAPPTLVRPARPQRSPRRPPRSRRAAGAREHTGARPVLAGAVITLTGALALHTARSNSRGRHWPTSGPVAETAGPPTVKGEGQAPRLRGACPPFVGTLSPAGNDRVLSGLVFALQ